MESLGVAVSLVGLLALASKVLDPLQQLKSTRLSAGSVKSLQAEVLALHEVLQSLRPLVVDNETQVSIIPMSLLNATKETLNAIMEVIHKYQSGSKTSRAVAGILWQGRIEHLREELDRHKSSFALILSSYARYLAFQMLEPMRNLLKAVCCDSIRIASTNDNIQALHRRIEHMQSLNADQMQNYESKLRESTEQASRDRILSWVSPYDFYAKHGDQRSFRMPGTCEWLIQSPKFSTWRHSSGGVFVLEGKRMLKA